MFITASFFGFIRYRVLAGFFTKEELDIFFAAFRIPDLIFEILITGALTTSFIPFFIKHQQDKEAQSVHVSSVINMIMLALIILTLLLVVLLPHMIFLITPGFIYSKSKTDLIVYYSQILLIGQLPFLVLGNFLTGISQANKRFFLPAVAPVVYNLAIIVMTFFFAKSLFLFSPIVGVILGAILFFLLQLPILFLTGFKYQFVIKRTKELWQFFKQAIPRIFTVVVSQIDATIDLSLTTLLGSGSYTVFYLAQRLQLLPVSVLGMAFGQASLPYLTEMFQNKNMVELKKIVVDSVLNVFFLTLPIACFFIFARTPIVRFFFGGPKFDWNATVETAVTLSYFSLSLPFHSIYYFLTRCFYALFDSKTPFYVSLISVGINSVLSLVFVLWFKFPVWSLALAFSFSMVLNVLILGYILMRRIAGLDLFYTLVESSKIIIAAILPAFIAFGIQKLLDGLILDTTRSINVFFLLVITFVSYFSMYLFLAWILNIKEVYSLTRMILKVKEYQRRIIEMYTSVE